MLDEANHRSFDLMFNFASLAGSNWNFYMAVSLASVGWAATQDLNWSQKLGFTIALIVFYTFLHLGLIKIYHGWHASIAELKKSIEMNPPATEDLISFVGKLQLQSVRRVVAVHLVIDAAVLVFVNTL